MCFPFAAIITILVWAVIIGAVVAILMALVSFIGPRLGLAAEVIALLVQIFKICLWAVICIAIIILVGDIITCLIGLAPGLPRLR